MNAGPIDEVLLTPPNQRTGYKHVFTPNGNAALTSGIPAACGASGDSGYSISATPVSLGSTGTTSYCVDETGVIRFNAAGLAIPPPCSGSGFPPLQRSSIGQRLRAAARDPHVSFLKPHQYLKPS